ncbi:Protein of unknown function [Gryllus bimaculatus]|nr:Protein of unknown function [Gryllus bimaculatus]
MSALWDSTMGRMSPSMQKGSLFETIPSHKKAKEKNINANLHRHVEFPSQSREEQGENPNRIPLLLHRYQFSRKQCYWNHIHHQYSPVQLILSGSFSGLYHLKV